MYSSRGNILNDGKWNRRLMNIYWICNALILTVELVLMLHYFQTYEPEFTVGRYFQTFILIPSSLIFFITVACEIAVRLLADRNGNLPPYVVTFTCVVFCAVLLLVHYNVTGIYVVYMMPIFFSLIYNNKRVLLFTFTSSLIVFILIYFGYFNRSGIWLRSDVRPRFDLADILTNIVMLIVAYFIGVIILGRFREITDILIEAEHSAYEAETAQKRAEAVAEARTRFLANMSHELRTPMNGIIGLSELTLDDEHLSERQKDYLLKIKKSAGGLLAIISDILDITKIDAGEATLEKIPFDLCSVLNDCEALMAHAAAEKGLRLYFYEETKLSNKIIGDPTKLRQALLNFLSNAVKFTKQGSITLVAKPAVEQPTSDAINIYFEINDTGIGMTREQCENIFEPFSQADNSITRSYGGTGLGLSIAKNIIGMMGGSIDVKSIPDIGSRFSFSLQFEFSGEKSEQDDGDGSIFARPAFDADVLLCEDDAINQQVTLQNLEKLGLRVVLAENGKECIETAIKRERENHSFDIILMDIHMPVMDGVQAAEELRRMNIKAPIIAMTANAMAEDREKYAAAGMADYLSKPFQARELWSCLLKYLTPVKVSADDETSRRTNEHSVRHNDDTVIDENLAIGNFAGNVQAFMHALDTFSKKYADTPDLLEKAVEDNDFPLAQRTAHTEKGASVIIGACRLSEHLAVLEDAFKMDGSYYNSCMIDEYKEEHSKVIQRISDLLL